MAKNKKTLVGRIGNKCKTFFTALTNPRFLLCFGIAWMLTNGWAYVFLGVGAFYEIDWMTAVGAAYMAFLWLPATPEKILTLAIAVFLLRILFPSDQKTLAHLYALKARVKRKKEDTPSESSEDHKKRDTE